MNSGKKGARNGEGGIPFGALDKKLTAERNTLSPLLTLLNISSEGKKNIIKNVPNFHNFSYVIADFPVEGGVFNEENP